VYNYTTNITLAELVLLGFFYINFIEMFASKAIGLSRRLTRNYIDFFKIEKKYLQVYKHKRQDRKQLINKKNI
jgi:uncharacterized membrane protein